ncbi:MAG: M1 family metallopeptidase [Nocardioidaceae bacterium]
MPGESDTPNAAELAAARSHPVEDPYYPKTSNPEVDALHYFLDLHYRDERLTGTTTLTFRATRRTDHLRLDLSDALHVSKVWLDDDPIDFEHHDDGLDLAAPGLTPDEPHTLVISYAGHPESTPAPSYRSDMSDGLGWSTAPDGSVYTFQEPYGAFTWYPVNDHPSDEALYDARIETAATDVGVFNGILHGQLSDKTSARNVTRWHVDEPVASYLITLAIGPYQRYTGTTDHGLTISYWLMPKDKQLLPQLRSEGREAFDWLTQHAGPYPFSSLGVVVVGGQSAMETQTMLTMSRATVNRPDAVVAHEMAHQWFGDSVSPNDWQGLWLSEGWAMYMQQWYEADTGRYEYGGGIRQWRRYDDMSRRLSGPPGDYDPKSFGDVNVYLGPAMMLDQIRQQVGDRPFEDLVRAWPAEHANENVDRTTFTRWINATTKHDFTPLIDNWLDSAHTPR